MNVGWLQNRRCYANYNMGKVPQRYAVQVPVQVQHRDADKYCRHPDATMLRNEI